MLQFSENKDFGFHDYDLRKFFSLLMEEILHQLKVVYPIIYGVCYIPGG